MKSTRLGSSAIRRLRPILPKFCEFLTISGIVVDYGHKPLFNAHNELMRVKKDGYCADTQLEVSEGFSVEEISS